MSLTHEQSSRSRKAWGVVVLVLLIEAIGGAAVLFSTVQGAFADSTEPLSQRMSILIAAVLAWIWVVVTLAGALRKRAGWVRGSAITMHVLLFAAGTGVLQFQLADFLVGWLLVVLAFTGFAAAIIARPIDTDPLDE